jgi:hypothetical protein
MRALLEIKLAVRNVIIVLVHAAYQIFLDNVRPHNMFLDKDELTEIENLLWDLSESKVPWEMEDKINRIQEVYNIMLLMDPELKVYTLVGQVREIITSIQRMVSLIKEK